jgi:type 1 glutamine amidotransferase
MGGPGRSRHSRGPPLAWYQEYDGGRAFYTALGHLPATYSDANFTRHIYGGIYRAVTGNGFQAN